MAELTDKEAEILIKTWRPFCAIFAILNNMAEEYKNMERMTDKEVVKKMINDSGLLTPQFLPRIEADEPMLTQEEVSWIKREYTEKNTLIVEKKINRGLYIGWGLLGCAAAFIIGWKDTTVFFQSAAITAGGLGLIIIIINIIHDIVYKISIKKHAKDSLKSIRSSAYKDN